MPDYREERIWSCLLTTIIVASFIKLSVVSQKSAQFKRFKSAPSAYSVGKLETSEPGICSS